MSGQVQVCCLGEAVVDLVPAGSGDDVLRPTLAGGAFTASVALARLGVGVAFGGCLSRDPWGDRMLAHLEAESVHTGTVRRVADPSTLAVVATAADGQPAFALYGRGTAGVALTAEDLAVPLRAGWALHVGGVALTLPPSRDVLAAALADSPGERVTFVDPNVRPALIERMVDHRRHMDVVMSTASIVKASDDDLSLLHPGVDPRSIARDLVRAGARMVVVTRGARGAFASTRRAYAEVSAPVVDVVDTIGAGDSFGAALLAWLAERGRLTDRAIAALDDASLDQCLRFAVAAGALACTRLGADPPRRHEVRRMR